MSAKELIALLRRGRDAWNAWRRDNAAASVSLNKASLRGMDLSGYDLHEASLEGTDICQAKLVGADLSGAQLDRASICWTHAQRATFTKAHLMSADLRFSNFEEAVFDDAFMYGANLTTSSLRRARLRRAMLRECRTSEFEDSAPGWTYFDDADLSEATLVEADLNQAQMTRANLSGAKLREADLRHAVLSGAVLTRAELSLAQLNGADLSDANLEDANLEQAIMVRTRLERSQLSRSRVYGVAAWDLQLGGSEQRDLVITPPDSEASVTVDDIEVAQFIYLLLSQERIRAVIDTITSKAVLILGRFTTERKAVLDTLRVALRHRNYVPIIFDFAKPASRDLTETIRILAHMARFVVPDLCDPQSVPHELMALVPDLPSVPVQFVIRGSEREYPLVEHLVRYPWVLPIHRYESAPALIAAIDTAIIAPAEAMVAKQRPALLAGMD